MWGKQPSVRYSGTKNKDFIIQGKTRDINFGKVKWQYEFTEVLLFSRKKNYMHRRDLRGGRLEVYFEQWTRLKWKEERKNSKCGSRMKVGPWHKALEWESASPSAEAKFKLGPRKTTYSEKNNSATHSEAKNAVSCSDGRCLQHFMR